MKKAYLYIALATILFSTAEISLKLLANQFNPVQITFLRFFIGSLILLPLALKNLKSRNCILSARDFRFLAFTGFLCIVVSMGMYQIGVQYAPAAVVGVLFCCNPVFSLLFASFILKERITKRTILSMLASICGMFVIIQSHHMSGSMVGILFTVLSAIVFGLYGVIGRTRSDRYGGIAYTCLSFCFGSIEMFILILLSRVNLISGFLTRIGLPLFASIPIVHGISLQTLPDLIYVALFVTALGFTFNFLALEASSAAMASLVFFIKPALAPILALIILKEPITLPMLVGIMLILTGSFLSLSANFKKNNHNQAALHRG